MPKSVGTINEYEIISEENLEILIDNGKIDINETKGENEDVKET